MLKTQLYVGKVHPRLKVQTPISNHIQCKANGGLFTSTFLGKETGSEWTQWCLDNHFNLPIDGVWNGWLVEVKKDAKIYVVDNLDDMHELYDRYEVPMVHGLDMMQLDFTKISQDYDAVHITAQGERRTRFPEYNFLRNGQAVNRDKRMRTMYGWDVESTHFFRDVFETVEEIELKNVSPVSE